MTRQPRLRIQKEKRSRRVIGYIVVLVLLAVVCRQLERHFGIIGYLNGVVTTLTRSFSTEAPARGTIYDRNLKKLALTMERVSVYVRSREIESIPDTVAFLHDVLDADEDALRDRIEQGELRIWVAKDISQAQEETIRKRKIPGVQLQKDDKRFYPGDFTAAHIVGYVDKGIGLSGVEYAYDRLLVDRKIWQQQAELPPSSSQDLVLTLDLKVQEVLLQLMDGVKKLESSERMAGCLLDARSGEILAYQQEPGFDPNNFTHYPKDVFANMLLEPVVLPPAFRRLFRDAAWLKNTETSLPANLPWCVRRGEDDLGEQVRLAEILGLGESSRPDFALEKEPPVAGQMNVSGGARTVWGAQAPPEFGMIPEKVVPLKLMSALAALLGRGNRNPPYVIKKILDSETGQEVPVAEGGMQENVRFGSLHIPQVEELFASQKIPGAGDCQIFTDKVLVGEVQGDYRRYSTKKMVFASYSTGESELCLLLLLDKEPDGLMTAREEQIDSEPLLAGMIEEKMEHIVALNLVAHSVADMVAPEETIEKNYPRGSGAPVVMVADDKDGSLSKQARMRAMTTGAMPDLVGMSLRKSLKALQGAYLKITIRGSGTVVSQTPLPGTPLHDMNECVLELETREAIRESPPAIQAAQ